jgi:hypothetical protein
MLKQIKVELLFNDITAALPVIIDLHHRGYSIEILGCRVPRQAAVTPSVWIIVSSLCEKEERSDEFLAEVADASCVGHSDDSFAEMIDELHRDRDERRGGRPASAAA